MHYSDQAPIAGYLNPAAAYGGPSVYDHEDHAVEMLRLVARMQPRLNDLQLQVVAAAALAEAQDPEDPVDWLEPVDQAMGSLHAQRARDYAVMRQEETKA